tara:strand:+ start:308 stop:499 length:192 start_codon:yes stop_codon:yes gene_type:complete
MKLTNKYQKVINYIQSQEDEELWMFSSYAQKHEEEINYLFKNNIAYLRMAKDGNYVSEYIKIA